MMKNRVLSVVIVVILILVLYFTSYPSQKHVIKSKRSKTENDLTYSRLYEKLDLAEILGPNLSHRLNEPFWMWDHRNEPLAHMHITKAGGTSFDRALQNSKTKDGCRLHTVHKVTTNRQIKCESGQMLECMCGSRHYEWTEIESAKNKGIRVAPLSIIRNPVSRIYSNYYFFKLHLTVAWRYGRV